jgi:ATP-dependent exoDNAse (exonuclease V) alpha subunit
MHPNPIGMPVMISANNSKQLIANGTLGYVCGIQWKENTGFVITETMDGVIIKTSPVLPEFVFIQCASKLDIQARIIN